jgi:hypothetical protein
MMASMPAALLLATLCGESSVPVATPEVNPYLAQARALYERLEPQACLSQLDRASRWKSTPAECVDIELLAGLCSFFSGNEQAAADRFELALRRSLDAKLPPNTSPKIGELFERIRQQLAHHVTEQRPPAPPPPAPVQAQPPSALRALPPSVVRPASEAGESMPAPAAPGAGRRSYWGPAALGGAAVLATAAGIILGVRAKQLQDKANDLNTPNDEAKRVGASAIASAQAANWVFAAAAGSAAVGVGWVVFQF